MRHTLQKHNRRDPSLGCCTVRSFQCSHSSGTSTFARPLTHLTIPELRYSARRVPTTERTSPCSVPVRQAESLEHPLRPVAPQLLYAPFLAKRTERDYITQTKMR